MLKFLKNILVFVLIVLVLLFIYIFFDNYQQRKNRKRDFAEYYQLAIDNYGKEVKFYAKKYNIPASYLMALIMLETSGKNPSPVRFEKRIYNQLMLLKNKKIEKFEDLTYTDLKKFNRQKIHDLASSYGPFQIMGYKTIRLGIDVEDLYNENAIKYGTLWIYKDYGHLLRAGRFADAFHYHNTGRTVPDDGKHLTYDSSYVKRGLEYMKYFSRNL